MKASKLLFELVAAKFRQIRTFKSDRDYVAVVNLMKSTFLHPQVQQRDVPQDPILQKVTLSYRGTKIKLGIGLKVRHDDA
jgi:hypothetical protein